MEAEMIETCAHIFAYFLVLKYSLSSSASVEWISIPFPLLGTRLRIICYFRHLSMMHICPCICALNSHPTRPSPALTNNDAAPGQFKSARCVGSHFMRFSPLGSVRGRNLIAFTEPECHYHYPLRSCLYLPHTSAQCPIHTVQERSRTIFGSYNAARPCARSFFLAFCDWPVT